MARSRILVTGAAGFIGSHTIDQLLKAGHSVYGVDNLRTGRLGNISDAIQAGLEFHQFDILDSERLNRLVKKARIEAIIHCAALVSVTESINNPDVNFRLNIEGTYRVAEAARLNSVRRLVFASSAAVYGDTQRMPVKEKSELKPISPYGAAKLASEYILLSYATAYGMTVRIQRYFNVYGVRQDASSPYSGVISIFARRLSRGQPITIYGDGKQTRDFIHVSDVAKANMAAATKPRIKTGIANICTGKPTSLLRLVKELNRSGSTVCQPIFAPPRIGDINRSVGCSNIAAKDLGFVAKRLVTQGLAELMVAEFASAVDPLPGIKVCSRQQQRLSQTS